MSGWCTVPKCQPTLCIRPRAITSQQACMHIVPCCLVICGVGEAGEERKRRNSDTDTRAVCAFHANTLVHVRSDFLNGSHTTPAALEQPPSRHRRSRIQWPRRVCYPPRATLQLVVGVDKWPLTCPRHSGSTWQCMRDSSLQNGCWGRVRVRIHSGVRL